jgi:hypothetical protein
MAKVRPVGTKRLGISSDSWPVFTPFSGRALARALAVTMTGKGQCGQYAGHDGCGIA